MQKTTTNKFGLGTDTNVFTRFNLFLFFFSLFVFGIAYIAPVGQELSDPYFSLVVSQSIIENGTIQLDAYRPEHQNIFDMFFWQVSEQNGHSQYNYPVGPSLVALPFVMVAHTMGADMLQTVDNAHLQNFLSAFICTLLFLIFVQIARCYLSPALSLGIAFISVLGSSMISSASSAYWNIDGALLFMALSLWLIVRYDSGKAKSINPYLLGLFLFLAFICRPTTAIFIGLTFIYLLGYYRRGFLGTAVVSFLLLIAFFGFAKYQYGQWVPFYYLNAYGLTASQLPNNSRAVILYALLFSPSRGLFIFTPLFLWALVGSVYYFRSLKSLPLYWFSLLWISAHIFMVSGFGIWWGGYSYGPRLLTETNLAFVILLVLVIQIIEQKDDNKVSKNWYKNPWVLTCLLLGGISLFINAGEGLFNDQTSFWNSSPSVDLHPESVLDWRYPQFLLTADSFHQRDYEEGLRRLASGEIKLAPYHWGEDPRHGENCFFYGWWGEDGKTFSEIQSPKIVFPLEDVDQSQVYELTVHSTSYGDQVVEVYLNETRLDTLTMNGEPREDRLLFDGTLLKPNALNQITFYIPTARFSIMENLHSYRWHRLGMTIPGVQINIAPNTP